MSVKIGAYEFEIDKIYKYEVPMKMEVAEPDQDKIKAIMFDRYNLDISGVDWLWESAQKDKNGYTGSFPKRLAKYVFNLTKETNPIRISERDLSMIGQIAKANLESERTLYFAITDHLDWRAGDFGDDDSCMFSSYSKGRVAMQDQGGMAVLFFALSRAHNSRYTKYMLDEQIIEKIKLLKEETSRLDLKSLVGTYPYGIGRCWFLPYYLDEDKDKLIYILFNHYGPVTTFTTSRMLATLTGYTSKRLDQLSQNYRSYGHKTIYINSLNRGGSDSYIMCNYDLMKDIEKVGISITG